MPSQLKSSPSPARSSTFGEWDPTATRELDIKLVCVGAANTGKTTFLRCWESGESPLHVPTTIQMEFHRREMLIAVPPPLYFEQRGRWSTTETGGSSEPHKNYALTRADYCGGNGSGGASSSENHNHDTKWVKPSSARRHSLAIRLSNALRTGSGSTNSSYASLPNPFGDEYAITAPRLPSFYHSVSTGCDSSTPDAPEEGEAWPLVHLPAIVKVWDIQGQEYTKRMTRIFYTGAVAVLIFCEVSSSMDSLTSALSWKSDVEKKIFISNTKPPRRSASIISDEKQLSHEKEEKEANPPCWLVVNKYDLLATLPNPPSWASRTALDELCVQHGFAGWSYTVGRKGVNVGAVVCAVIAAAVDRFPKRLCGEWGDDGTIVPRTRSQSYQRNDGKCCSK